MAGAKSPLGLQSLLGDIGQRRALAMALRAQEQSERGGMVSGKYVPSFRGVGGALARGMFGDPLDALRQEEQGAFGAYEQELGDAMSGIVGANESMPDADFGRTAARAQTAGVPQEVITQALQRRESWNMLNGLLAQMDAPRSAGGGASPGGGGVGAAPGAVPAPPSGGPPMQEPQGGPPQPAGRPNPLAAAAPTMDGGTPLKGVPEAKLFAVATTMAGKPIGAMAKAELEGRRVEVKDGGMVLRRGQLIGKLSPDGVFYDAATGQAADMNGGIDAQRAGAKAGAEAGARAPYQPQTVQQGRRQVTTFLRPGGNGFIDDAGGSNAAPQTAGAGGGAQSGAMQIPNLVQAQRDIDSALLKIQEGAPPADIALSLQYLKRSLAQGGAAPAGGPPRAPAGGERLGVGADPLETKAAEAAIEVGAAGKKEQRKAQITGGQQRYEEITKAYQGSQDMKPIISGLRDLDRKGVFSGPPQEIVKTFANWANSAVPGLDFKSGRVANSQDFDSEISRLVQGIAKNFPGAQSDRELQQLLNSLPSRMQDPKARAQLYDKIEARIAKLETTYRDASKVYRDGGDMIGWEPPAAPAPAARAGKPVKWSDLP